MADGRPGTRPRTLYESRPELAHAIVDVEPNLTRILGALPGSAPRTSAPIASNFVEFGIAPRLSETYRLV